MKNNIWPFFTLIVLALLALQSFTPSAPAASLPVDRFEQVKKAGVLRCGYVDYPPYFSKDPNTGKVSGIMVDVMDEIAKISDLKIEWAYETTFGTIPSDLNENKFDAYCANIWLNSRRAREGLGTDPVGYAPLSLHKHPKTAASLEDGVYMAIDGTFEAAILQRRPGLKLNTLPGMTSFPEELQSLAQGKADYALLEDYIVTEHNAHNPDHPIEKVEGGETIYVPITLMVAKGQNGLADFLNTTLLELRYSGAAKGIWQKHNAGGKIIYTLDAPTL